MSIDPRGLIGLPAALRVAAVAVLLLACGDEADPRGTGSGDVVAAPFGNAAMQPGGTAGTAAPVPPSAPSLDPTSAPTVPAGSAATSLPCDVASVVANNCHQCHGPTPVGGAIRLVEHADWHQPSPLYDPTKQVYEVAQIRINNGEMPQGGTMPAAELATLDAWLAGGAVAAAPGGDSCTLGPPSGGPLEGSPPVEEGGVIDTCLKPGAYDPPRSAAGPAETCYDFKVTAPGGAGPFDVPTGESYHEWYYDVPWPAGSEWSRFGAEFDNLAVLHHYLVFTSSAPRAPGDVLTNVLGTTLGTGATLIGGWAVGGCGTILPDEVAGQLPPAPLIMIQWHMFNTTGLPARDASTVQICVVPPGTRPNTAGITFLGTENFNGPLGMPPGQQSFTTQCTNNSGAPITVVGFNPHMHLLGTHMKTDIRPVGGEARTIFDMPFQFDYQVAYEIPPVQMMPGDSLVTTCSFFNDTGTNVAFGESTNEEMCYQFALSFPAGALQNSTLSLIGALNTCW